jgi:hypothetical protein
MPVAELYRGQAAMPVSVVPFVAVGKCFAPKGGTAINLFGGCGTCRAFRWTFISPIFPWRIDTLLTAIDAAMRQISAGIGGGIRGTRVDQVAPRGETRITKLNVQAD